jgi:hypothetical protein
LHCLSDLRRNGMSAKGRDTVGRACGVASVVERTPHTKTAVEEEDKKEDFARPAHRDQAVLGSAIDTHRPTG